MSTSDGPLLDPSPLRLLIDHMEPDIPATQVAGFRAQYELLSRAVPGREEEREQWLRTFRAHTGQTEDEVIRLSDGCRRRYMTKAWREFNHFYKTGNRTPSTHWSDLKTGVIFLDTSLQPSPYEAQHATSTSKINVTEARIIAEWVVKFLWESTLPSPSDLCIIAFYAAQLPEIQNQIDALNKTLAPSYIRRIAAENGIEESQVEPVDFSRIRYGTPETLAGTETPYTILSLTATGNTTARGHKYLTAFAANDGRLNTAISRSMYGLMVVGCVKALRPALAGTGGSVRKPALLNLIVFFEKKGQMYTVPESGAFQDNGDYLEDPEDMSEFYEDWLYRNGPILDLCWVHADRGKCWSGPTKGGFRGSDRSNFRGPTKGGFRSGGRGTEGSRHAHDG